MSESAATCPGCGHDAHTPRYCVMLTDDGQPCACGERTHEQQRAAAITAIYITEDEDA